MIWSLIGLLVLAAAAGLLAGAWWLRLRVALLGLVAGVAAALIALLHVTRPAETLPVDPNPSASFRVVALGDSYISGEGAQNYFRGTDDPRKNRCHRAATAHPYLVAQELGASLTFVACSGARTRHVTGMDEEELPVPGQYPDSPEDVFGGRPQVEELRSAPPPDAVLLSIGGNDAGFSEIGRQCATPTAADCRRSVAYWVDRLDKRVFPALVRTYTAVREAARGAPVFVLTYPNPIGPEFCPDIGLTRAELGFVRDVFVGRLNDLISFAAVVTQVRVIDLTDALAGERFCERPLSRTAVNFIQLGRTEGSTLDLSLRGLGSLGHGTFHPNARGHRLMAEPVRARLRAVQAGTLEALPEPPPPGIPPPPFVPSEIGPPVGPHPFPAATRCHGQAIAFVSPVSAERDLSELSLSGVRPRSTVCHRSFQARWGAVRANAEGEARVPLDLRHPGLGGLNEVLAEQTNGVWKKIVVSRLGTPGETELPEEPSRLALYVVLAVLLLAVCVALGLRWAALRRPP